MRLFGIPTNTTVLRNQPIFSKRIVIPRSSYKNRRKIQAKPGQIVYIGRKDGVTPMRVLYIDDFARWACKDYKTRYQYNIGYDLQPLIKTANGYRAKKYIPFPFNRKNWNGWIGHSVDMNDFCLTYAEARFDHLRCANDARKYK